MVVNTSNLSTVYTLLDAGRVASEFTNGYLALFLLVLVFLTTLFMTIGFGTNRSLAFSAGFTACFGGVLRVLGWTNDYVALFCGVIFVLAVLLLWLDT